MDKLSIHSGKLRAIGYDAQTRILSVELEDGSAFAYANVGESIWRTLKNASSPWSYYRDNIAEEFTASRVASKQASNGKNPLDDLFK